MIKTKTFLKNMFAISLLLMILSQEIHCYEYYSFFQLTISALIIVILITLIAYKPSIIKKFNVYLYNNKIIIFLYTFMIANTIIGYINYSYNSFTSIFYVIAFSIIGIFEFLILPILFDDYPEIKKLFDSILIKAAIICSIISLLININNGRFIFYSFLGNRNASIFWDSNFCGMIIANGFLLLFFNKEKSINKLLLSIICLLAIYLTKSRGTALSLILCFFVYYIFDNKRKGIKKIFFIVLYISISYLLIMYMYNTDYFRIYQGSNNRIEMWKVAYEYIKKEPIFGYGYQAIGNFLLAYGFGNTSTHNSFIDFVFSYGIIASVLYIVLLLKILIRAFINRKKINTKYLICCAFSIFNSMTITYSFGGVGLASAIFTIFLGLINYEAYQEEKK